MVKPQKGVTAAPRRQWRVLSIFALCSLSATGARAGDNSSAPVTGGDHGIYQQSIKSTKKSIDREMIEFLYHDAMDAYQDRRYDEALELLDKIYSLDPHYEDVAKLRAVIQKAQNEKQEIATMDQVRDFMRKGDQAFRAGQNMAAINFWKQALAVNPNYEAAQKKIQQVNQALARREFESGYIHYHHGEMEDALDSWSNAIALDPSYKQRGLLLLMSKVQLQIERDQMTRLAAQGFEQFQAGNLEAALQSYAELQKLQPRNEEARRYSAKIKIQLSEAALKAAREAMAAKNYQDAISQADKCISYGYEVIAANKIKADAENQIRIAKLPKPKPKPKPVAASTTTVAAAAQPPAEPPPPPQARDPEQALLHYRKGLAAIRTKDYHLALQELDIASQLDPTNEHIYIARQRAQQEWSSANSAGAPPNP